MTKSDRMGAGTDAGTEPANPQNASAWPERVLELTSRKVNDGFELNAARRELYQALLEESLRITPARRGSVRLYDRQCHQSTFCVTAGDRWTDALVQRVYRDDEASACAHVVRTRQLYVIDDVRQAKDYRPLWDDVRSHTSIPIFLAEQIVAVLSLDACQSAAFDSNHCTLLLHLVADCSNLLAHFALFEVRWRDEFERFMAGENDEKSLCDGAIPHLKKLFGVLGCSIFLLRPGSKSLTVAATTGIKPQGGDVPAYEIGQGLTGWVAKHGRTLRLRDTRDQSELSRFGDDLRWRNLWPEQAAELVPADRFGVLAAPLVAHERVIGVLRLSSKESGGDFEVEDEILLERVAERLALSVSSIWTLEHILRLNKRLPETLDVETACRVILEEGLPLFGCDSGHIRIFDASARNLRLVLAAGPAQDVVPKVRGTGEGISGLVTQQMKERFVCDLGKDPELLAAVEAGTGPSRDAVLKRIGSLACLPLIVQQEPVGTLTLSWATPRTFEEMEMKMMRELAVRSAMAIRAAQMYQEIEGDLKRKIQYLSRLRDMFLQFAQIRSSEGLFQKIVQTAREIVNVGKCSIWLRDEGLNTWRLVMVDDPITGPDVLSTLARPVEVPDSRLRLLFAPGKVTSIPDLAAHPQYSTVVARYKGSSLGQLMEHIGSLLVVPFDIGQRCIGVLAVSSEAPYAFPESIFEYLEILGGYAAVAIEDTQLYEKHEQALRLAQPLAMMGAMMGSFLHSLRTPIHKILLALNLIEHPKLPPEKVPGHVADIRTAVLELSSMCDDIAYFAAPGRTTTTDAVDLNEAVRRSVAESITEHPSITCDWELAEPAAIVQGNRIQLEKAMTLIVRNAFEAMPNGGRLVITTRTDNGVRVLFKDSGIGMDVTTRAKCLEPFFTTKQGKGGTGLGLSVAFGIMTRHGGSIDIESEPGQGTTITLIFPQGEGTANAESTGC